VFGFCLYCGEMYLTTPLPGWMLAVEIFLTLMYTADLVFYGAAAERKVNFLTSWHTAIDVLSILPVATPPRCMLGRDHRCSFSVSCDCYALFGSSMRHRPRDSLMPQL